MLPHMVLIFIYSCSISIYGCFLDQSFANYNNMHMKDPIFFLLNSEIIFINVMIEIQKWLIGLHGIDEFLRHGIRRFSKWERMKAQCNITRGKEQKKIMFKYTSMPLLMNLVNQLKLVTFSWEASQHFLDLLYPKMFLCSLILV